MRKQTFGGFGDQMKNQKQFQDFDTKKRLPFQRQAIGMSLTKDEPKKQGESSEFHQPQRPSGGLSRTDIARTDLSQDKQGASNPRPVRFGRSNPASYQRPKMTQSFRPKQPTLASSVKNKDLFGVNAGRDKAGRVDKGSTDSIKS